MVRFELNLHFDPIFFSSYKNVYPRLIRKQYYGKLLGPLRVNYNTHVNVHKQRNYLPAVKIQAPTKKTCSVTEAHAEEYKKKHII